MTREEAFWARFEEGEVPDHRPDLGPCWIWTGATNKVSRYGQVYDWRTKTSGYAHRLAFELAGGEIPEGHQVDHLCRVRPCGRPSHLEAVTGAVNIQRGHEARGVEDPALCACGAVISKRNVRCRDCYLAGVVR